MYALNSNSLALSVVSNIRRSLRLASPRNFARARVCILPAPQSPSPKLETTRSLVVLVVVIYVRSFEEGEKKSYLSDSSIPVPQHRTGRSAMEKAVLKEKLQTLPLRTQAS